MPLLEIKLLHDIISSTWQMFWRSVFKCKLNNSPLVFLLSHHHESRWLTLQRCENTPTAHILKCYVTWMCFCSFSVAKRSIQDESSGFNWRLIENMVMCMYSSRLSHWNAKCSVSRCRQRPPGRVVVSSHDCLFTTQCGKKKPRERKEEENLTPTERETERGENNLECHRICGVKRTCDAPKCPKKMQDRLRMNVIQMYVL